jgi:histidyl-tRNA synthetase
MFDRILDGDAEALESIGDGKPELRDILFPLLNLRGKSSGFLKNLKALSRKLPDSGAQLDDFINIAELLGALGCDYKIDIASGAGFEYYTGVIFQLFIGAEKIGGGGRYDALILSMGGGNIPASGFALYLDRLMKLVKPEAVAKSAPQKVLVRAESGKTNLLKETFSVASRLRENRFVVELGLDDRKPVGFRWVLDVRGGASPLALTDTGESEKVEARNVEEVSALLREKGANKDSPA